MPKPPKFTLIYRDEEMKILEEAAIKAGYKKVNKWILYQLIKKAKYLMLPERRSLEVKKQKVYVRINHPGIMEKLSNISVYHNQHISILIKRLVTDPVLLEAMMEAGPDVPAPLSPPVL